MEEFKTSFCIRDESGTLNGALSSSKTIKEIFFALEVIASDMDMFEIFSKLFTKGIFEESNKCNINYEFTDRRAGDTAVVVADNKLALSILDWEPKRNIKSMCKDGWKSVQIFNNYELNNNFTNEKKSNFKLNYF